MTSIASRVRVRVAPVDIGSWRFGTYVMTDGRYFVVNDSHERYHGGVRDNGSIYVRYSNRTYVCLVPIALLAQEVAYRVRLVVKSPRYKDWVRFLRHGLTETHLAAKASCWDLETAKGIAERAAKDLVIASGCAAEFVVEPARR